MSYCQKSQLYSYPTFGTPVGITAFTFYPDLSEQELESPGFFAVLFA